MQKNCFVRLLWFLFYEDHCPTDLGGPPLCPWTLLLAYVQFRGAVVVCPRTHTTINRPCNLLFYTLPSRMLPQPRRSDL